MKRLRERKRGISSAAKKLKAQNSVLISITAHEIKTPLAVIKEGISLIGTVGSINKEQQELIKAIDLNLERLNNLINDLFENSRLQRGDFELSYSEVNLVDLIMESAGFFKKLAEEKKIDLEYKFWEEQIIVPIDAGKIRQVVVNLVNNAIKFTQAGGKVKITGKPLREAVIIAIKDTGIGVAKSDMKKIFQKFVRLSQADSSCSKGLGLGLTISRDIIEKHGGVIGVNSVLGVGSNFYFILPLDNKKRIYEKDYAPEKIQVNNRIKKIILD